MTNDLEAQGVSFVDLLAFSWECLHKTLQGHSPVLSCVIMICLTVCSKQCNHDSVNEL